MTTAQTRERLLEAAFDLFREQGFVATSLAQVARRAGFTTGAVYVHFESKEDLFLAMLAEGANQPGTANDYWAFLAESDGGGEPDDGTTRSALRRLGAVMYDHFAAYEPADIAVQHELVAYAVRNPRAGAAGAERIREQLDRFGTAIAEGFAAQGISLRVEPRQLVVLIDTLINGLTSSMHFTPEAVDRNLWLTSFELLDGLVIPRGVS